MRSSLCAFILVCCFCAVAARAALYEFTIEGVVTQTYHANVSLGNPFTMRYIADSQDLNPSPTSARYVTTLPTVTLPNATFVPSRLDNNNLYVVLDLTEDRVRHISGDGRSLGIGLVFRFPPGTLFSDALPVLLPLSIATSAAIGIEDFASSELGDTVLLGDVMTYSSVPEPGIASLLPLSAMLARRRARKFRPNRQFDRA